MPGIRRRSGNSSNSSQPTALLQRGSRVRSNDSICESAAGTVDDDDSDDMMLSEESDSSDDDEDDDDDFLDEVDEEDVGDVDDVESASLSTGDDTSTQGDVRGPTASEPTVSKLQRNRKGSNQKPQKIVARDSRVTAMECKREQSNSPIPQEKDRRTTESISSEGTQEEVQLCHTWVTILSVQNSKLDYALKFEKPFYILHILISPCKWYGLVCYHRRVIGNRTKLVSWIALALMAFGGPLMCDRN